MTRSLGMIGRSSLSELLVVVCVGVGVGVGESVEVNASKSRLVPLMRTVQAYAIRKI